MYIIIFITPGWNKGTFARVPPVVSAQRTFAGVPLVQCQHREPSLGFHPYSVSTGNFRWGSTHTVSAQGTFAGVPPVQCQHREPSLGFHWYSVSSGDHDHYSAQGILTWNNQRGTEYWLPEPPRQALLVDDSFDSVMVYVNGNSITVNRAGRGRLHLPLHTAPRAVTMSSVVILWSLMSSDVGLTY